MASNASSSVTAPDGPSDTILQFPDNRLLIDLCGELDRNIVQIEQRLGVAVHRRGNQLALLGTAPEREAAERVLQNLYARLEQGRPVTPGEIDAAIRMGSGEGAGSHQATSGAAPGQLEMFGAEPLEIRTRRKIVEPRTPGAKGIRAQPVSQRARFRPRTRGERARPILRSRRRWRCSSRDRWTG